MTITQEQTSIIYSEIDFLYAENKKLVYPSYYVNKKIRCLLAVIQNKLTLEDFLGLISPWEQKEYVDKLQITWSQKPQLIRVFTS